MGKIRQHAVKGAVFYTDDFVGYNDLHSFGKHLPINHRKVFANGRAHINGIEGFWSYAKNWLYPYRGVPSKYLHLYLGEVCYRFNHRDEDLQTLLYRLLRDTPLSKLTPLLVQK